MAKERSSYWDTLKGFLIFLVVFGHCGTTVGNQVLSVVYAFHMPLFVLVSGYFSKKKTLKEFLGGVKRLIIIYLVFDALYIGLDYILGDSIGLTRILTPSFALWYILSLIYWRTILQFTPDSVLQKRWLIICGTVLLALTAGFIPLGTQMSFQRTFVFFPFFVMGFFVKSSGVIEWVRSKNKVLMTILFMALCVICYIWLPVFYAYAPYVVIEKDLGMRLLQIIVAILMCGVFLGIVPEKMGRITEVGKWTLLIYLLHPPIVKLAKVSCSYVGIPMKPNIPVAIIISVMTIALIYIVRRFKVFKYIS